VGEWCGMNSKETQLLNAIEHAITISWILELLDKITLNLVEHDQLCLLNHQLLNVFSQLFTE